MRLEDLRSTLDEHAGRIQDAPQARIAPVRRRVAVARRRRAAGVAGAAALAVVAAAAVALPHALDRAPVQPADAPATLAGREVPRTQTAAGFDYRYTRGFQSRAGTSSLEVGVRVGDTPRLVMWASSDTSTRTVVRLRDRTSGDAPEISTASGFSRYAYLPAGGGSRTERLRLTQSTAGAGTRLAVAVYDIIAPMRAGQGNGTIVYRDRVLGDSLVRSVIGDPGQTDLRFRMKVTSLDLAWADTCYGSSRWYSLTVAGRPVLGTDCSPRPELDAGAHPATFDGSVFPAGVRVGDTVTVRLHLSPDSGHTRSLAQDPDAVLALGLYTHRAATHRVAGVPMPDAVEDSGHQWLAHEWLQSDPGRASLRAELSPSDRPRLVRWVAAGTSSSGDVVLLRVSPDGSDRGTIVEQNESAVGGISYGSSYVVQPGQSPVVTLEVTGGSTSGTRLGLVVSDLVH